MRKFSDLGQALALGLVLLFAGASTAVSQEQIRLGTVTAVEGAVQAVRGDEARALSVGAIVFRDDTIITGDSGRVEVELHDGSTLTLALATRVVLAALVVEEQSGWSGAIALVVGALRLAVEPAGAARSIEVTTEVGAAAVRSTELVVETTGAEMAVLVQEGVVAVMPRGAEEPLLLDAGEGIDLVMEPGSSRAAIARGPAVWSLERVRAVIERTTIGR